jgi:hypothetical protein
MTDEAVKLLNDLKHLSPGAFSNAAEVALIYVGLDQKDQAMAWLEKAYAERFSPWSSCVPASTHCAPTRGSRICCDALASAGKKLYAAEGELDHGSLRKSSAVSSTRSGLPKSLHPM